jgi:hypothetical protein
MMAHIWTANYLPVFPFTPATFSVGALFPAILYMFRWGNRRGRGRFGRTFAAGQNGKPSISSVATLLSTDHHFSGFDNEIGRAILGDLLLAYVLENKRREEGQNTQVQRIFPTHYFASWIDLPESVAHLRGVPEMIVALLVNQPEGQHVESRQGRTPYPIGCRIEENEILRLFAPGTTVEGDFGTSLTSDRFDESASVALDQLVTIRLAQTCASAPEKARGKGEPGVIPNQKPIATRATQIFYDDLAIFSRTYASIPRLSLLPMLETCIALNLANIFLSTMHMLENWTNKGYLQKKDEQRPWPLFVDCSLSMDHQLRRLAEQSWENCRRRIPSLALTLMYLRLLDYQVRYDSDVGPADLPSRTPDATSWLNLLGDISHGSHEESKQTERFFRRKARELADALDEGDPGNAAVEILRNEQVGRNAGWRLAEALMLLMGAGNTTKSLYLFLNSCLMTEEPNGLARRRRIRLRNMTSGQKTGDATSTVLTNTALEFLTHRHLRRAGKGHKYEPLSLPALIETLRHKYGLYIDQAPPDLFVPNELLIRNRRILERRLRDLGLLMGVNDAERMKRIRPRFAAVNEAD